MIHIKQNEKETVFVSEGITLAKIAGAEGVTDTFTELEEGVWEWTRRTAEPVNRMEMAVEFGYQPSFWMVPAVNYNGNGFGKSGDAFSFFHEDDEYSGMGMDGKPWTYGFDRCSVPAAVYSEGNGIGGALMADGTDRCSCSMNVAGNTDDGSADTTEAAGGCNAAKGCGHAVHTLHWPLTEGPKVLWRDWQDEYRENMEPRQEFRACLLLQKKEDLKYGYDKLLDFAWRKLAVIPECEWDQEQLWKAEISYAKRLWEKNEDGFCGFNIGMNWKEELNDWGRQKEHKYEIGWCGQNASLANSLLIHYLRYQDQEALDMGAAVLDSWAKYAWNGKVFRTHMDNTSGGTARDVAVDACNLGTAAVQYFNAADLAVKCGLNKPAWLETAVAICDFALEKQEPNGRFAKSWDFSGNVAQAEGTVGCFLVPALVKAWQVTGEEKYLESAEKAYAYYRQELLQNGYTTAGALDTFCVDKESAMPLLMAGIDLYEMTKKDSYLEDAVRAAWYLSTWQWHYNIPFPEGTLLNELAYKTCGTTAVSTAHHHLDAYALCYCRQLHKLAELTGNDQWEERANAVFNNSTQLISDGTLTVFGKTRPLGSQDEGMLHTRWGREYSVSQWLVAWPCAFRLQNLW